MQRCKNVIIWKLGRENNNEPQNMHFYRFLCIYYHFLYNPLRKKEIQQFLLNHKWYQIVKYETNKQKICASIGNYNRPTNKTFMMMVEREAMVPITILQDSNHINRARGGPMTLMWRLYQPIYWLGDWDINNLKNL